MKNVHVLPHSEIGFNPKRSTNIYITTNEKPKLNDWFLDILDNVMFRVTEEDILTMELDGLPFNFKKIILTTDQELIKDGVQAIDDDFLQWFVENPSCEEIEVEPLMAGFIDDEPSYYENMYKIIIPKEATQNLKTNKISMNLHENIHRIHEIMGSPLKLTKILTTQEVKK
jgi:hypothetical protein